MEYEQTLAPENVFGRATLHDVKGSSLDTRTHEVAMLFGAVYGRPFGNPASEPNINSTPRTALQVAKPGATQGGKRERFVPTLPWPDVAIPDGWLKITNWRYHHASADLAVEHDSHGWLLLKPRRGLIYPVLFSTPNEAMEFTNGGGR